MACIPCCKYFRFEPTESNCFLINWQSGVGKSRWLNKLIPPSLKQYSVQGIFDPRDKDTKILMSENLIGNLDELDSIEKRTYQNLKNLLPVREVNSELLMREMPLIFPVEFPFVDL